MKCEIKSFNKWIDKIKNCNEIDCIEHIKKKYNSYALCIGLINELIDCKHIIDKELKYAILVLQQIINEAKNNIEFSKTGFSVLEGQDRGHLHSLRYIIASKIKNIYLKDAKGKFISCPIEENIDIDLNQPIIKNNYEIFFETYRSNDNLQTIKLEIIDENINHTNKLKKYDFVIDLNNTEKISYKKTTGIVDDNYIPFYNYELKNIKTIKKIINYKNDNMSEQL